MPRATTAAWEGLAAAAGEDALRLEKTVNIVRLGSSRTKDHLLARIAARLGRIGVEPILPGAAPGEAGRPWPGICRGSSADSCGHASSCSSIGGSHAQQRTFFGNQPLPWNISTELRTMPRAFILPLPGLQTVKRALFDGELEILHLVIVRLSRLCSSTSWR